VFVGKSKSNKPFILWSPADNENCQVEINSFAELNKLYPELCYNSKCLKDYNGQLFKSKYLGDYQLMKSFPAANEAGKVPTDVVKLLGIAKKYVGAYPPKN